MMARPKITLYVDTVSPFSYIAYFVLRHDPAFAKCDITFIPILLGGVMKAANNTPPIQIKNKDKWIELERHRWARLFSVPLTSSLPPDFPPFTLPIMRNMCALTTLYSNQEILCKALDALYQAYWVDSKHTHQAEVLREILSKVLGEEDTKKVNELSKTEGKNLLLQNTDQAFKDGAFGLPWFVCTDGSGKTVKFWGCDRILSLAEFLGLEKPAILGWKAVL